MHMEVSACTDLWHLIPMRSLYMLLDFQQGGEFFTYLQVQSRGVIQGASSNASGEAKAPGCCSLCSHTAGQAL